MRNISMLRTACASLMLVVIALFASTERSFSQSAGFNSSYAVFSFNGGSDSYYCMMGSNNNCFSNPTLDGAALGTYTIGTNTLVLKGSEVNNFKCGGANISGVNLNYRIYKTSATPGSFISTSIGFLSDVDNGCGGKDQQWKDLTKNINVLSGLVPGNYTIEIYLDQNTTVGQQFLSNNSNNYKATFTVAAASGSPVVVSSSGGTTFATYATLGAAFTAINSGTHTGTISIVIGGNTNEGTTPATLNSSGAGSASYTSINIAPAVDGLTISGNPVTGFGVIQLNGADNVTIDGDNPNTSGTNRNLTITNSVANTTGNAAVIRLIASTTVAQLTSCDNDVVKNCVITGNATGRNISTATSTSGPEHNTYGILVYGGANTTNTAAPLAITSVSSQTVGSGGTFANFTANNNRIDACARGIMVGGSATTVCSGLTITNNVIGSSTSGNTTTVYSRGLSLSGFDNTTISGNTIQNMESFVGTSIAAIFLGDASSSGANATIEKNTIIHVFNRSTSTFGSHGIALAAGANMIVRNNFISDIMHDQTGGVAFGPTNGVNGIRITAGTGHKIYHNTVSLFGAMPGTATTGHSSQCLGISATTLTGIDVRNNIFSNTITGGSTSTAHVSILLPSGGTSSMNLTLNNNAYYCGTATNQGIAHSGTSFGTIYTAANFNAGATTPSSNWRSYSSTLSSTGTNDNASFATTSAAPFTSSTDLHIPNGTSTQLESGGANVGVTTDIDGNSRSTTPDIGADEFTGVAVDLTAPSISYTALTNTCNTTDRTLSATITDVSGVPAQGSGTEPRIYFKKNAGSYFSAAGTLSSGTVTNGVWSFTISSATMGGVAASDVISYYVVAQDVATTPNIASNPSGVTSGTVNSHTAPSSPNTYTIGTTLSGTYSVGAGNIGGEAGHYSTLTAAIAAYNANCLGGAVTFVLTDASYSGSETFPIVINANSFASATNTLTIKPNASVIATISGSSSGNALIKLNGADYVIIDGSNSGGTDRSLTITNTNTTSPTAIWVGSAGTGAGATNDVIKNCNINTGSNAATSYGILVGASSGVGVAGDDNDNLTLQNNNVTKAYYGIWAAANSTGVNDNLSITGNLIGSYTSGSEIQFTGILVQQCNTASINGNTVQNVFTTAALDPIGIHLSTGCTTSVANANKITDVNSTNTGGYGGRGIQVNTASATSNLTISNNMISNIKGTGWNSVTSDVIAGIILGNVSSTIGGVKLYYNSVNLGSGTFAGNSSGTISGALIVASSSATTLDIRNNILVTNLVNSAASGAKTYAIYSASANTAFSNIDYNDYSVSGTQGVLGFLTSDRTDLAGIQSGFGSNTNSKTIAPVFTSATDLHLPPASNVSLNNLGTFIAAVTTDIDGDSRDGSTPDMGMDEFVVVACSTAVGGTGAGGTTICSGNSATITASGYSSGTGSNYQWEFSNDNFVSDIHDLSGQTNPASASTGTLSSTTYYRLRVSCATNASTDYSTPIIQITVNPTPSASVTPAGPVNSCTGNLTQLSAVTNGSSPTYQWIQNGADISGQNASTYTPNASGSYSVRITAGGCSATSTAVTVNVNPSPTGVTATAAPTSLCEGGTINLTSSYDASSFGSGMSAFTATRTTGTSYTSIIPATTITTWRNGTSTDDNLSDNQPIGFSFTYGGVAYTDFRVSTNGFITFNNTSTSTGSGLGNPYSYTNDWTVSGGGLMVAPNWDDLQTAGNLGSVTDLNNSINYSTTGAPGSMVLTVEWKNMQDFSSSSTASYNWQVKLYQADNHIEFVYGTMTQSAASVSYSLGLSGATVSTTPTAAQLLSQTTVNTGSFGFTNQNSLTPVPASNTTISFSLPTPTYSWTGPNSFTSSLANPSVSSATTAASGVYQLVVTNSATGCSSTTASTANVTVNANVTYYQDFDNDTYGNLNVTQQSCTGAPAGYVANSTDCNDNNSAIHPGATEVCNGIDDNCVGGIDEGVQTTFYADADGDGFGNPLVTTLACTAPAGYVSNNSDCNDAQLQYADNDGDGFGFGSPVACGVANNSDCNDAQLQYADNDGDGFGAGSPVACGVANNTDCNDADVTVHASQTYYADVDGDGFGDLNNPTSTCSSTPPPGYVTNALDCNDAAILYLDGDGDGYGAGSPAPCGVASNNDCNDANAAVNPGATEVCNGVDDDCVGGIDNGLTYTTYYVDADHDTYGSSTDAGTLFCSDPGVGYSLNNTDCNDAVATTNPGASEICGNGIDDDCNTLIDDGCVTFTYYLDFDNDTYGDINNPTTTNNNTPPPGYVTNSTDCNDNNSAVNPGAAEVCNGIDDDCDNLVDNADPSITGQSTWYADADGDTYGNPSISQLSCSQPAGYVSNNTDCNDGNNAIHPGVTDLCNSIDDDCDNLVDEDATFTTYYVDADHDTYGSSSDPGTQFCSNPGVGYSINNTDCNDGNNAIHPGVTDVCNSIDDDCDNLIDEDATFTTYYVDADHDTYGSSSDPGTQFCSNPGVGYSTNHTDCNDGSAAIHPGATELCNGIDDDCNNVIDDNTVAPTASFTATCNPMLPGNAALLTSTSTANAGTITSYQWILNGSDISGATNSTYTTGVNANGNYQLRVTNSNGCSNTSAITALTNTGAAPLAAGTYTIPSTTCGFSTIASAVTYINANGVTGTGNVIFDIVGNGATYSETAPVGGYSITATGTSTLGIIFRKSPSISGAVTITASSALAAGTLNDAIFKLVGADYITLDGLTMKENAANVTIVPASNNMTEWGVALLYASTTNGAQNNTIKNCNISLNKTYPNTWGIYSNTRHINGPTSANVTTAADITNNTTGPNSNNKVYTNTISNVNFGIAFIGSGTAANQDVGNDVGGSSLAQGNTISNWGGIAQSTAYVSSPASTSYGLLMLNQVGDNTSYNTVSSATVAGTSVTIRGIQKDYGTSPTGTFTSSITNNTVTISDNFTSGTLECIRSQGMSALSTATININNNTILNTSVGGASSSTTIVGIVNSSVPGVLNMNSNIIQGCTSTATTGGLTGVSNTGAVVTTINMNNNQIGNSTANAITFSAATSGAVNAITSTGGASTCSTTIQNNDIRRIVYSVASGSTNTYITATAAVLNLNVSNNTFTNLNVNTTSGVTFISQSYTVPAAGTQTISGNSIVTAFNKAGAGGTVTCMTSGASTVSNTAAINHTNNNFSNITVTGATTLNGISNSDGLSTTATTKTITGNTFSNWTGGTSAITVMSYAYVGGTSSISNNTISTITGQGGITGITIGSSGNNANPLTVQNNSITGLSSTGTGGAVNGLVCSNTSSTINISNSTINNLSSTGASQTVTGLSITGAGSGTNVFSNTINTLSSTGTTSPTVNGLSVSGGTTTNAFKNKIGDLVANGASSPTVNGVNVSGGTTVNVFNNRIGDLRAPTANTANAINGMNATGGSSVNFVFNTVRISATSSGTNFGTSALNIGASSPTSATIGDNIFVNTSTPNGTGLTVAFRKGGTALTNYGSLSNYNLFYAGTPGASNLIFYDGTNSDQTLAAFQTRVASRDNLSVTESVNFLSTTFSNANFLKIDGSIATQLESGGLNVTGITDDFEGDIRAGNTGYAGTGTAPDIGADEFAGTAAAPAIANVTVPTGGNCTSVSHVINADVTTASGTITSVTLNYNNGAAGSVPMSFVSGNTYTGTIPGASPTNTNVTWSITAVNSGGFSKTFSGASYNDATPLATNGITITATPSSFCGVGGNSNLTAVSNDPNYAYTWTSAASLSTSTGSTTTATVSQTSSVTVTGVDGACQSSKTISIGVYGFPSVIPTATPSTVCTGGTTTLTSGVSAQNFAVTSVPYAGMPVPGSGVTTFASAGTNSFPSGNVTFPYNGSTLDDGVWSGVPIGFTFNFFGNNYTTVNISTNGNIQFTTTNTTFTPGSLPNTTVLNFVAPFWTDMYPVLPATAGFGIIRSWTTGVAPNRIFVVEYNNVGHYNSGTTPTAYFTGQIWLYETTGAVEVHIGSITGNGSPNTYTWSTGVNNLDGSIGAAAPNRNNNESGANLNTTNESWHFEPPHNYTFNWQPAAQISGSNTLTSVTGAPTTTPTTTYSVTVTDPVSGCTSTATVPVTVQSIPTAPSVAPTSATVCEASSTTLTATINTPGNTIKWYDAQTNGNLLFTGTTFNTPAITTNTTFWAEENNGTCGGTRTGVLVSHINAPAITVTNDNPSFCGTPVDPIVSHLGVSSTNDPNYAYSWAESNSGTLNTLSGPSVTATNTVTTTYTVTATDASTGCIKTANTSVSIFSFPTFNATANPASVCAGTPSNLSAGVSASNFNVTSIPFAGMPVPSTGVTTLASSGANLVTPTTVSISLDDQVWGGIPIGFNFNFFGNIYNTVNVSSNGNIQFTTQSTTFTPGSLPNTSVLNFVAPFWTDLYLALANSGEGIVRYWTSGASPNQVFVVDFYRVGHYNSGLAPVIFYSGQIWLYQTTGVVEVHISEITSNNTFTWSTGVNNLTGSIGAAAPNRNNNETGTFLTASNEAWRFSPPINYAFAWTPAGTLDNPASGTPIATPLTTTTYSVTVTDPISGCQKNDQVTVTVVGAPPATTVTPSNSSICTPGGSAVALTASGDPATYTWTPSSGLNVTTGATVNALPSSTTTYTVTSTAGSGCTSTTTATVNIVSAPTINSVTATPSGVCTGGSSTLFADVTGASTLTWSPATYLDATTGSTVNATNVTTTVTYTVTASNGLCTSTATVTLNSGALLVNPTITQTSSGPACSGSTFQLNAGNSGGGTPYAYTWAPVTGLSNSTIQNPVATVASTTTYTVTVTDNCNNSQTGTVTATVFPFPSVTVTPPTSSICAGSNSSVQLNANGSPATYTWAPSSGLSATTGASVSANPSGTTNYVVTATAASGCTSTASGLVNVTSINPIATASPSSVCPGSPSTLSVSTGSSITQNFDGVTAPALPSGWNATNLSGTDLVLWTTTTTTPSSLPNAAFVNDPAGVNDKVLESPSIFIGAGPATLTFNHIFTLESTFDGGVLEISIDGGSYQDIVTAGGSFVTGGYTSTISTSFSSPIGGRQAWSGTSSGFPTYITVNVTLPASAVGHNIKLRWRMASDTSVSSTGWWVDDVQVTQPAQSYTYTWSSADNDISGTTGQSITATPQTAGTHTYTVSATDGTCTGSSTVDVTVLSSDASFHANDVFDNAQDFTFQGAEFCAAGNPVQLVPTFSGGTFTGPGVVEDAGSWYFDPSGSLGTPPASIGQNTVTYAVGCATHSETANVESVPTVTLSPFSSVCHTDAPFTLTGGSPAGGIYKVDGTEQTTFDPSAYAPGSHTIQYFVTGVGQCQGQSNPQTINVDATTNYYADNDGDGFGAGPAIPACSQPAGTVANNTDCNDNDASVHALQLYYVDGDGDSYGSTTTAMLCSSTPPTGYSANNTDCNDGNASIYPTAPEQCNSIDDNCNGQIDESVTMITFYADVDGDSYGNPNSSVQACSQPSGYVLNNTDCNDGNPAINPAAIEVCNGVDDDCDTQIDEGVQTTFYADADGDTYGDINTTTMACTAPAGYVSDHTDCDDGNSAVHPGAAEVCNLIDDNCNGQVDEGVQTTFYADTDGDSYGDASSTTMACTAPAWYVSNSTDCNDGDASVNPGATESCNGVDDDCNGQVDDNLAYTVYYVDGDHDGYGAGTGTPYCSDPGTGYSTFNTDCNDAVAAINPGATEVCNLVDDDCDGQIDEGVQTTFFADADGDSYGDINVSVLACTAPAGYVVDKTDCDDTKSFVHPGASETCNLIDDNCNGQVDEGVQTTFYADADGDTYGDPNATTMACSAPSGYVADNTDCNDANEFINPGASEQCNGVDDNCNGQVDDGITYTTYYVDGDNDGYGFGSGTSLCSNPGTGYSTLSGDCNDANNAVNPGATEICGNSTDDNCDGLVDEGCDGDGDGYTVAQGDCDDTNPNIHPGAIDVCNGIDDNCSGVVDENAVTGATASSNSPQCAGGTLNLFSSSTNGTSYSWAGPNAFTSTLQNPSISNVTTAATGTYTVTVTNGIAGCSMTKTTSVTINATPTASASSNSPICAGSTLSLSSSGGSTYAWAGPNSFSSTLQNPSITNATTAATGTYTVTVSNSFGCSSKATASVTVNAVPTASASSNSPVCAGNTLTLSSSGGSTYAWAGPNSFSSTLQNPSISNVTTAATGTYTVTVSNGGACTANATTAVTVKASPNPTASNNSPICQGSALNLTSSGGGAGGTYSWAGPNSFTSTQQNPSISNAQPAATGTYTVTVTNSGGCSKTTTTTATVNPTTAISQQPVAQTTCVGSTVSFSVTATGGNLTYQWKKSNTNITGATNSTYTIVNVQTSNAGNYKVVVTGTCGSVTSTTVSLTVNTGLTATASSNSPVCAGGTLNLSATGGTSYAWSGPNAFTSTLQNPSIAGVTAAATGTYTVTVSNSSGCSATKTTAVTVNPSTSIGTNPASQTKCVGQSVTFTVVANGGSLTYQWKKNTTSITGATTSSYTIASVVTGDAATYTVVVTGTCGSATSTGAVLTVNPLPTATASSNSPVCAGSTLTLNSSGGTTYAWAGPNSFTSTLQNPSIVGATTVATGTYTVTVTNSSGCSSKATTGVVVNAVTTWYRDADGDTYGNPSITTQSCTQPSGYVSNNTDCNDALASVHPGAPEVCGNSIDDNCNGQVDEGCTTCTGFRTYSQGAYGNCGSGGNSAACQYTNNNFAAAFPGGVVVGCTKTLTLTTVQAVRDFLPSSGTSKKLTVNYVDPGATLNNTLAGQVTALALSLGFDLYDPSFCSSSTNLKDLYVQSGTFAGWTVQQVFDEAKKVLGGCTSSYTPAQLNDACNSINLNYDNGTSDNHFLGCTPVKATDETFTVSGPEFKLYPNPNNGVFIIELNLGAAVNGEADIQITNMIGQRIYTDRVGVVDGKLQNEMKFNKELPAGTYFVRVLAGEQVFTGQVVVQK